MSLFRSQFGVCTTGQLVAVGISRPSISAALRRGLIEWMSTGVVGLSGFCDRFESKALAVHLSSHRRGYLSGVTAGHLHGLRAMSTERIEYTIDAGFEFEAPGWVALKRTSWDDTAPRPERSDGLVVASPLRTLFQLAGSVGPRRFARAAEDAWQLGLVTPEDMAEYLAGIRRRGRGGVKVFEEWVNGALERREASQSSLEDFVAHLAVDVGLSEPERQYPLTLRSGITIHLDLAWPELRLAVEPGHTWWHGGNEQMRADQARDRQCAELGWLIVRFDETVREHPDEAGRQLRQIARDRRMLPAG